MKQSDIEKINNHLIEIMRKYIIPAKTTVESDYIKKNEELIRLNNILYQEIVKQNSKLELQSDYINYLLNSYWWKITGPLRLLSRITKKIKRSHLKKENIVPRINNFIDKELETSVMVILFTRNSDKYLSEQISNIINQKGIKSISIKAYDFGSTDKTLEILDWYNIVYDSIDILNPNSYQKIIDSVSEDYLCFIKPGVVFNDNYLLYKGICPIENGNTMTTIFFNDEVKKSDLKSYYLEFYERLTKIDNYRVLFFPKHRDSIQYINYDLLNYSDIFVKKKHSDFLY